MTEAKYQKANNLRSEIYTQESIVHDASEAWRNWKNSWNKKIVIRGTAHGNVSNTNWTHEINIHPEELERFLSRALVYEQSKLNDLKRKFEKL